MNANTILWIYIGLLIAGGMMGFLKAGSKASLIASCAFAAVLALCATEVVFSKGADIVLAFLLVFFGMRLAKSKKMMPNGMMLILTAATLVLRHL